MRPLLIIGLAAILVGIVALALPAWENDVFTIRKMRWFQALLPEAAIEDSLVVALPVAEHAPSALDPFWQRLGRMPAISGKEPLAKARFPQSNRQLRIAYFSDSTIEGDLITAPLRDGLQSVYGGAGVGMMPITSIVSGFRQTIRHSFSRNWESISFMSPARQDLSLGITGYTFIPRPYYTAQRAVEEADTIAVADTLAVPEAPKSRSQRVYINEDPWVEYRAVSIAGGAASFESIRLFYANATDSSRVMVSYDSQAPRRFNLRSGSGVQGLDLSPAQGVKTLRLEFDRHDPIHVYGVSFDAERGVYVDNFPIRGYSGMYFSRIHADVLSDFNRYLDYDLVILQYGENVSNQANTDYTNYKNAMIRTVEHIQKAMPKVPILIVSAHDRSIRDAGGYRTSPDIPILVQAQAELAQATDSAFFNLYEAMGGYNSMIKWVSEQPPMASTDYTHFNRRGADRVAGMLLNFLREPE